VTAEQNLEITQKFHGCRGKKMPNEDAEASYYMQATAHIMSKGSEFREIFQAIKHFSPFFISFLITAKFYDR
jgi:hypothetical protein